MIIEILAHDTCNEAYTNTGLSYSYYKKPFNYEK